MKLGNWEIGKLGSMKSGNGKFANTVCGKFPNFQISKFPNSKNRAASGFSLIEVMVATLILMILVLMTGAVFKAGASAWDTGYAKAEGGAIVRTVAGVIQRELSKAVDARYFGIMYRYDEDEDDGIEETRYGGAWDFYDEDGKPVPVYVNADENGWGDEIHFIYFRDNLSKVASSMKPVPVYVKYWVVPGELKRQESNELTRDNSGRWRAPTMKPPTTVIRFADEINPKTALDTKITFKINRSNRVRKEFEDQHDPWRVVSVVTRVEIFRSMKMSTITVRSYGPDGQSGNAKTEKDDIILMW